MPDERESTRPPDSRRWLISPALWHRIIEAGFVPGSGNPILWLLAEVRRLTVRLYEFDSCSLNSGCIHLNGHRGDCEGF